MYQEILVPTDGSPEAEAAIADAVDLARTYDARIHAIYVVDPSTYNIVDGVTAEAIRDLEVDAEAVVDVVASAAADAGVDATTAVLDGGVHETITAYVRRHHIDLVVMGTHGRRGIDRYLHGSVAERVMRTAPTPVMTVRGPDPRRA